MQNNFTFMIFRIYLCCGCLSYLDCVWTVLVQLSLIVFVTRRYFFLVIPRNFFDAVGGDGAQFEA